MSSKPSSQTVDPNNDLTPQPTAPFSSPRAEARSNPEPVEQEIPLVERDTDNDSLVELPVPPRNINNRQLEEENNGLDGLSDRDIQRLRSIVHRLTAHLENLDVENPAVSSRIDPVLRSRVAQGRRELDRLATRSAGGTTDGNSVDVDEENLDHGDPAFRSRIARAERDLDILDGRGAGGTARGDSVVDYPVTDRPRRLCAPSGSRQPVVVLDSDFDARQVEAEAQGGEGEGEDRGEHGRASRRPQQLSRPATGQPRARGLNSQHHRATHEHRPSSRAYELEYSDPTPEGDFYYSDAYMTVRSGANSRLRIVFGTPWRNEDNDNINNSINNTARLEEYAPDNDDWFEEEYQVLVPVRQRRFRLPNLGRLFPIRLGRERERERGRPLRRDSYTPSVDGAGSYREGKV